MSFAIPDPGHRCWQTLANGGFAKLQTRQLALQLLFKRLQSDPSPVQKKSTEIHAFFVKYAAILGPEINQLPAL